MPEKLSYKGLRDVVSGDAAAFRRTVRLQPVDGPGGKVFPPTYSGAIYATEKRWDPTVQGFVETVLLDSVASQANRMEMAVKNAYDRERIALPMISMDLPKDLYPEGRITVLDVPHRMADAALRESRLDGVPFRDSPPGLAFTASRVGSATPLFGVSPTSLLFGVWDSTGFQGALGAKFPRALVSEIVAYGAEAGVRTASRIDPLPVGSTVKVYQRKGGGWTALPDEAEKAENGQPKLFGKGRPSEVNLGNVTPDIARAKGKEHDAQGQLLRAGTSLPGGVTFRFAMQSTVLSLSALRRLRFPLKGGLPKPEVEDAARSLLAALGLVAISLTRQEGYFLRSRCQLIPEDADSLKAVELVPGDGSAPERIELTPDGAIDVFRESVKAAQGAGLPWSEQEVVLEPNESLLSVIRESMRKTKQKASAGELSEDEEDA